MAVSAIAVIHVGHMNVANSEACPLLQRLHPSERRQKLRQRSEWCSGLRKGNIGVNHFVLTVYVP